MSQRLGIRPSELVDLQDPTRAYRFDQAIVVWGAFVESELDKIEGNNEKQVEREKSRRLDILLGKKEAPGRFADPAMLFAK